MIERSIGIREAYKEQSPGQIETIQARYRKGLEAVEGLFPGREMQWLDIGSNFGHGLSELKGINGGVYTIDIEKEYLQAALENNPHVKGCWMSGANLGFPDGSFNAVSSFEVVEHLDEKAQRDFVGEIHRVLSPDGIFVLSTPNKIASRGRRTSPDHKKELTFSELTGLLTGAGFRIEQKMGQGFYENDNQTHHFLRWARENPFFVYVYWSILPGLLRNRIRDVSLASQQGSVVRKVGENETERLFFVVCRKNSDSQ